MMADDLLFVRAGEPFKIPVIVEGRPAPKVVWDFYGKAPTERKNKLHQLPIDCTVRAAFRRKACIDAAA